MKLIDKITILLVIINIILTIIGGSRIENRFFYLILFLMIPVILFLLIKYQQKSRIVHILRDWYPIFLFGLFFEFSSVINRVFIPEYLDLFFQKLDFLIFGYQPAIEWGMSFDNFLIQEIMHFGYFSYYLVLPGIGVYLYLQKDKQDYHKYLFLICFIFYSCYLIFNFLPVIGGRYWKQTLYLTQIYRYGLFTRIMAWIYNITPHWGSAFPSSHIAVMTAANIYLFRLKKTTGLLFIPLTILLSLSTVYCHYHYFVDLISGIMFGVIMYVVGIKIYSKDKNV